MIHKHLIEVRKNYFSIFFFFAIKSFFVRPDLGYTEDKSPWDAPISRIYVMYSLFTYLV